MIEVHTDTWMRSVELTLISVSCTHDFLPGSLIALGTCA